VIEPARIDKQSTVVHNHCRYSVPVRYARQHSRLRIHAERVEILIDEEIIVAHERGEPGQWKLEFEHYIPLLNRKPGWLDFRRAPLVARWADYRDFGNSTFDPSLASPFG
jgi:hypothetical protein